MEKFYTNTVVIGAGVVGLAIAKEISDKSVSGSTSYNRVSKIGTGYGYGGMNYPSALDAIQVYSGALTQTKTKTKPRANREAKTNEKHKRNANSPNSNRKSLQKYTASRTIENTCNKSKSFYDMDKGRTCSHMQK